MMWFTIRYLFELLSYNTIDKAWTGNLVTINLFIWLQLILFIMINKQHRTKY